MKKFFYIIGRVMIIIGLICTILLIPLATFQGSGAENLDELKIGLGLLLAAIAMIFSIIGSVLVVNAALMIEE